LAGRIAALIESAETPLTCSIIDADFKLKRTLLRTVAQLRFPLLPKDRSAILS
jgi:hypothetical protein